MEQITGAKIFYGRVSTEEQTLDLQIDAGKKEGCVNFYVEKVSGASKNRPELDLAIKDLQPGDVLVVWRLDRLGRNVRELYRRIDQIYAAGATFKSIMEQFDFGTIFGKVMLAILGALAEFERDLVIQRTTAGIEAARAQGKAHGRPPKLTEAKQERARQMFREGKKQKKIAKVLRVSPGTLYHWRKREKIKIRKPKAK
jgi:DNA invertase Pin-like site-specific DNA recombinase